MFEMDQTAVSFQCDRCHISFDEGTKDLSWEITQSSLVPAREFDLIHMRKDPPFDQNYLALTWVLDRSGPAAY